MSREKYKNEVFGFMYQADTAENVAKIEKWIFYFLCGYALLSSATIAGGNIFLGLATAAAIFRLVKKHDDWKQLLTVDWALRVPFFIFLAILVATSLFSTDIKQSVDTLLNHYVNRIMPFLLVLMFVREKERLIKLTVLAALSIVVNDATCIVQWNIIGGKYLAQERTPGLIGIMMTGGMNSMWVPVLVLLFAELKKRNKYIVGAALLIAVMGTIYNNTRGAWLAIVITVSITLLLYTKSKLKVLVILLIVGVGIGLMTQHVPWLEQRVVSMTKFDSRGSNLERLLLWKSSRHMAADYPLTGVGYGCFTKQYQEKYILPEAIYPSLTHAHSNFFHTLAENGYPGAVAVSIWWLGTLWYCVKGWYKYKKNGYIIFMAIFLGLMLQGVTEYTMGDSIVMKLFWFGLGVSYQWTKLNEKCAP